MSNCGWRDIAAVDKVVYELLDAYNLKNKLNGYSAVYIYGAGYVGKSILEYLDMNDMRHLISCFFITDNKEGQIEDIPIKQISKDLIKDDGIIILAAKRYIREQLKQKCIDLDINNYMEIMFFDDERDYKWYSSLPEELYPIELKHWYRACTGEELNLNCPKTFNDKINWMKLHDNNPKKTEYADKYLVRKYVKDKIGNEYLVRLLGVWKSFDEIDFERLPNKFVLKCTHGCGWNVIVKNKDEFNYQENKIKFDKWMKTNFAFVAGFEMHYKDITPQIIAEEYMENKSNELYDYKFWCFNGKVEFIMFLCERQNVLKMNNYDLQWRKLPFTYNYENTEYDVPKPQKLGEMISIAEKLAEGFSHVRVDLYQLNDGTIKFGEMTFSSASGACKWNPKEIDYKLGNLLKIKVNN